MTKLDLAKQAIKDGKTMGRFLRELPGSKKMGKDELSEYGHAYAAAQNQSKPVKEFAAELADAYSTDRYKGGWSGCIKMLRQRGYDDRQVEAIIRSKWTRWAGDASGAGYGHYTSKTLADFIDSMKPEQIKKQVEELVRGTFAS